MGGIHQTVEEVVARRTIAHLLVEEFLQARSLDLTRRCCKHDALTFLNWHLEIAGHVEVLVRGIAALLFLRILHTAIPVGLEVELVLLRELHVEVGIAGIHAGLDTIVHQMILARGHGVLVRELAHRAEGQERTETQRRGRVGIFQRVANEDAVLVVLEKELLLQNHAAHTVDGSWNLVTVKLANVLVTLRTVVVALILMQTQVELGAMLNDGAVERRQQHVVLVVEFRNRYDEQAVILADIAIHNRRARVSARTVGAKQLLRQRILQVCHQSFFKSQITHVSSWYLGF